MFMIINESERNRIKSLYGLITEESPPSESVLVAKKNPFKYPEYETARREYSSQLKDGDLFYISNIPDEYDLEKYSIKTTIDFLNQAIGKTMRYDSNSIPNTISWFGKKFTKSYGANDIWKIIKVGVFDYDLNFHNFEYSRLPIVDFEHTTDDGKIYKQTGYPVVPLGLGGQEGMVIFLEPLLGNYISFQGLNKLYGSTLETKNITELGKRIRENLPDEYFEIRKIQRDKTDL